MVIVFCFRKLNEVYLMWSLLNSLTMLGTLASTTVSSTTPMNPGATQITSEKSIITTIYTTTPVYSRVAVSVLENTNDSRSTTTPASLNTTFSSEVYQTTMNITKGHPLTITMTTSSSENKSQDFNTTTYKTALQENFTTDATISESTNFSTANSIFHLLEESKPFTTSEPMKLTCQRLSDYKDNPEVVCLEYEKKVSCEDLKQDQQDKLRSVLCDVTNTSSSECHLTLYASETNHKCILWVPNAKSSKDVKEALRNHHSELQENGIKMKWDQISDHRTKSQKTMIALVTCGVLLAFFILVGYFFSNRESWTPGRQRLGEDSYYTEADSQGNTLVSVSAHSLDKTNNTDTKENGTGTTSTTNGHSKKKQSLSDTKV
ncbi:hypothetical protein GDO86_003270 [Hymenochirus boettgeri]|uniref:Hematopoietic progenitor cell antigen CD34 n=1 Tax=Hymenochirus boettgeri TaxID=247094 RepID=A0A8T2K6D0_9PIPI|nr:hypothetical protein GDO86_003270 [Hymenochirus boettgeri]